MQIFNLKQLLYNPAVWVHALSGFRDGQSCCRGQLWYTGLEGHAWVLLKVSTWPSSPGRWHWSQVAITPWDTCYSGAGKIFWERRTAIEVQERVDSLNWGSLMCVTVKLNSDSHVLWQSTVLSIQQHSCQGLATLCHLVGCLTFCITYILLIVVFYSICRKKMPVYLYWTLSEVNWNQFSSWAGPHFTQHYQWAPRLSMRGVTHWTPSQDTVWPWTSAPRHASGTT